MADKQYFYQCKNLLSSAPICRTMPRFTAIFRALPLVYFKDTHCILLLIDFAFWMQESYKDGEPENGIIQVEFQDVDQYLCEGGDPTGAFVGILGSEYSDGAFILKLLDDETNEYFEMNIKASSVTVTII